MDSGYLKVLFVFVLTYAAMVILGSFTALPDFSLSLDFGRLDYTIILLPVTGFFFVYMVLPWAEQELGFGKIFLYAFPAIFTIFSYVAFYVALSYYFGNQASLSGITMQDFITRYNLDFFSLFINSSFVYFVIAGVGGWGARLLMVNFDEPEVKPAKKAAKVQVHEVELDA
ncbi:MAG: hypothetical protein NUV67_01255 [archaeon]|nr:hypothetical protein [archaeon]